MSHEDIKSRILAKHDEIMQNARDMFPAFRYAPNVRVYFYETGRSAGMAHGDMRIGYNLHIFAQDLERFINDTIAHEIAHIVCMYTRTDRGHGKTWKRVCRMLGGNGQRCYASDTIKPKMIRTRKTYEYIASCGTIVMLSDVIHGKVQRGQNRVLNRTKGKLDASCFTGKVV